MNQNAQIWGVIPAAGIGTRMGSEIPKQYLRVQGRTILEHSLQRLLAHPRMQKVMVITAAQDNYWPAIRQTLAQDRVLTAYGGKERYHSVYAGLIALAKLAQPQDWVLVHDAVRPYLSLAQIDRLIVSVEKHNAGGLLALPVRDTLKLAAADSMVASTLDRTGVWLAQTPQMFRLSDLTAAMEYAIRAGRALTDEAEAIEFAGGKPLLVPGDINNIKLTYPEDLLWIERTLGDYSTDTAIPAAGDKIPCA